MKFFGSPFHREVQATLAAIRANDSNAPMALAFIDRMPMSDKRTLLREAPTLLEELGRARAECARKPASHEAMEAWIATVAQ